MAVRVKEAKNGLIVRRILTGMIVSSTVLSKISSVWDGHLFDSPEPNIIASICVNYWKKYRKPPIESMEPLIRGWAEKHKDDKTVEMVESLLGHISREHEQAKKDVNPDYVLDIAGKYFNQVRFTRLAEGIADDLADGGESEVLEARIAKFKRVEMGVGAGYDLFTDEEEVCSTFERMEHKRLIQYPGAIGEFFSHHLERDGFISFCAPDKTGKTFWLEDMAFRAILQHRKVAFFSVGDLSRSQINMRFLTRAARHPHISPGYKWPYTVQWPVEISGGKWGGTPPATVVHEERTFDKALDPTDAWKAVQKLMSEKVRSKKPYLKMSCHSNNSINVAGIRSILETWDGEDWLADIVIVDYADILAPPEGIDKKDPLECINKTWQELRKMSQELHCLVITATQSTREGYEARTLSKVHASGDKRKNAHVTGMIGLNMTSGEKELGITRLNWLVLREGEFNPRRCVHVAGCLPLANPCVVSTW